MCVSGSAIDEAWNPVCLGKVHGVLGKVKILPGKYINPTQFYVNEKKKKNAQDLTKNNNIL